MVNQMDLINLSEKTGLSVRHACSKEEAIQIEDAIANNTPLPFPCTKDESGNYFRIFETSLTEEEKGKLIQLLLLKRLTTIKNCLVFFTTLTVVSLAIWLIMLLGAMD